MTWSALVLAGSRGETDPVALAEGVVHKALAVAGGKPLLARVIAAVREAGPVRIAVVANHPEVVALARSLGTEIVAPEAGPSASVAAGLAVLGTPTLVTTADHALLQGQWIRDFMDDAPAADVAVLLARRDRVESAQPDARRTWLRMADGDWSGCNLFWLATPKAAQAIGLWQEVEANRKRPWRIAARLGIGTLLRYALGRLSLDSAVVRIGRRAGITAHAVAARNGLAAVDVDKPEDLAAVRAILDSGQSLKN